MEREGFFSGYCRGIDGSRTVAVEAEGQELTCADCDFPGCAHIPNCPVAKSIQEFLENG